MAVYKNDRAEDIASCLLSLVDQTVRASEVVLVEDGPVVDEVRQVIERYRSTLNIMSVRLERNLGFAGALNAGLQHCNYGLIARIDPDDVAAPSRFELQLAFMVKNPGLAAASGSVAEVDECGKTLSVRAVPLLHTELKVFAKTRSPLNHPATIFRRDAVLAVGGYPNFRRAQDYALWSLLIVKGYQLGNLPDIVVRMRCGEQMYRRRGVKQLIQEIRVLHFQRKIGFCSWPEFLRAMVFRLVFRLVPNFFRRQLYIYIRGRNSTSFD